MIHWQPHMVLVKHLKFFLNWFVYAVAFFDLLFSFLKFRSLKSSTCLCYKWLRNFIMESAISNVQGSYQDNVYKENLWQRLQLLQRYICFCTTLWFVLFYIFTCSLGCWTCQLWMRTTCKQKSKSFILYFNTLYAISMFDMLVPFWSLSRNLY